MAAHSHRLCRSFPGYPDIICMWLVVMYVFEMAACSEMKQAYSTSETTTSALNDLFAIGMGPTSDDSN